MFAATVKICLICLFVALHCKFTQADMQMMIFEKKTEQRWAEGCVPRHPEMVAIVQTIHQTKLMSYSKHKKGGSSHGC